MKRIDSLQSIRLFASLGVFQYHLWNNYLNVQIGHPGTDLFLALVGMVAALSQARRIPSGKWGGYLLSRMVRLYVTYLPLFLLTLAVKRDEADLDWILRSFLFLPIPGREPLIGATWMLTYFVLFYILFSLAFLFQREIVLWPVFLAWAAGIMAYSWLGWKPGIPKYWADLLFFERNLTMVLGYTAGMILRSINIPVSWGRVLLWSGLVGILTGVVLLNTGHGDTGRSLFVGMPVAAFLMGLVILEKHKAADWPARLLTWPGLVWLGGTSYVLYLSNGIFLSAWSRFLPVTPILVPVITLCAIAAAAAGTVYWEGPWIKRLRGWLKLD